MTDKPSLEVKDLVIHCETNDGVVKALDGVNTRIDVGKTLGLVRKTGTGKTTLAKGTMRPVPNPPGEILGGEIIFEGQDLLKLSTNRIEAIHDRDISVIFQDPMTSLSPALTVDEQIMEAIENRNTSLSRREARKWTGNMLEGVGIPAEHFGEYPHQFSGGIKQKVVIAVALACSSKLFITDELTTALGVTMQAQMLEMIYKLKSEDNTPMILITHDLRVIAQNCDYVAIIYVGEVVEYGTLRGIYKDTKHPYMEGLFGSIPSLTSNVKRPQAINGVMPDPTKLPEGCVFCGKCKYAVPEYSKTHPGMVTVDGTHQARCIRYR